MKSSPTSRSRTAFAVAAVLVAVMCQGFAPRPVQQHERADGPLRYVFVSADGRHSVAQASSEDLRAAEALGAAQAPLLYVRHGDGAWLIRDRATLDRVTRILEPQQVLGRRQSDLGERQAELGQQQARLGEEQGDLGVRQARLSRDRGAPPIAQISDLARRQAELGQRQAELGRRQGELGRRQGRLGEEQARLASVTALEIGALLERAIEAGTALRLD